MNTRKNILICPLDWGLGHATRMVPVIKELELQGAKVILAADNGPYDFFKKQFPNNILIKLTGFSPKYPDKSTMAWEIIKSLPQMFTEAKKAKKELTEIIKAHNINAIISDNRYELSNKNIPSVFVTHQLNIQTKGIQKLAKPFIDAIINSYLSDFAEIWIPDNQEKPLSGILSTPIRNFDNIYNIGLLSRFYNMDYIESKSELDLLVICSGPEPQRTIFEELIIDQVQNTKLKTVVLQAKPGNYNKEIINNLTIISHVDDYEFVNLLSSTKHVISRPGYSTLMDLCVFSKKAIFIPTPGQTEQEYLAKKLLNEGVAFSESQSKFNLEEAMKSDKTFTGLSLKSDIKTLKDRIANLLNNC